MFSKHIIITLFLLIFFYIKYSENASLSVKDQKKYKKLIDGEGLYSADDEVEILTKNNFKGKMYGQKNAWLIEFYNSWCGFCQRFAPSWKALASDIRNWKDKINIGAIDCANDSNNDICREFEIMAYPTVRYFHENYIEGPKKFGEEIDKGDDLAGHKASLITKITQEQIAGRGKQYPNLLQYNYTNLNHLFEGIPLNTKYVFLIIEAKTKYGAEVALDLANVPEIAIKYTQADNTVLMKTLGINKVPHMIVLSDTNESQQFSDGINSRETFKMAIEKFLRPKDINIPNKQERKNIYTGKWIDAEVPDMNSLMEAREKKALRDKIKSMGDVVFQIDLESALRYALKHEIGNVKLITGEKRVALIAFLDLIIKYFPLSDNGKTFILEINDIVKASNSVSDKDLAPLINRMNDAAQKVFSSKQQWLACDGSSSKFRGYPCGLWKLFHYITVNAALKNNYQTNEVLPVMHGYIKNFFGCADCSKHFQQMAKERRINSVTSADEAVLWLWKAHNVVNQRLSGDTTEDPEFPKIQFPSAENCPSCKNVDGTFNELEIIKYLKNMYSSSNLRYIGSDSSMLITGLGHHHNDSSLLKRIDASMCFILYIASLILIIALIRMFLKRGYRKKMYVHDLLGKV